MRTAILHSNPEHHVILSLHDRLFLGESLFETLKIEDGRICYPILHWERLKLSASELGIPFSISAEVWFAELEENIVNAKLVNGGIKVILTGGIAPRGLVANAEESCLLLHNFSFQMVSNPLRLKTSSWRRDAKNPIYRHKTINYLESILARREAAETSADDVLFLNSEDHLSETTVANIFLIKNEQIYTPSLTCGVLPGIIRNRVLALCKRHNIVSDEALLTRKDILDADAVFVTNSLQGIMAVASLDNTEFDTAAPLLTTLINFLRNDLFDNL